MTLFCIRSVLVRYKEIVCNNELTVEKYCIMTLQLLFGIIYQIKLNFFFMLVLVMN